jgi:UDP-N-acetylmuramate dehydrogenase
VIPAEEGLGRVVGALGASARRDALLGPRTTYRIGGPAAALVELDTEEDLAAVHRALREARAPVPVLVVGKGSNLLVADEGFPGLVLVPGRGLAGITVSGTTVRAGAAAGLPVVARRTAALGLRGMEWAVGVPGSVGGALRMNAGGHGSDTAAVLARARVYDLVLGVAREMDVDAFGFAYRTSGLHPSDVVVWAEMNLQVGEREDAEALVSEIVRWRRQHQPGGSNCGSVFTNPPGDSAGRLVEAAGLKGERIGSAWVSEKHANFVQADDGGRAADVRRLVEHVIDVVDRRFGVRLRPELQMVGFPGDPLPLVEVPPVAAQGAP